MEVVGTLPADRRPTLEKLPSLSVDSLSFSFSFSFSFFESSPFEVIVFKEVDREVRDFLTPSFPAPSGELPLPDSENDAEECELLKERSELGRLLL